MYVTPGSILSQNAGISIAGNSGASSSQGIEDSSIAIGLLIVVSLRGSAMPPALSREYESDFLPFMKQRMRVLNRDDRRDINPFAAAFLAESILRTRGIKTAQSRIVAADEARKLPANVVVKFQEGRRLHWHGAAMPVLTSYPGRWALVSEVVSDSASVDFVRRVKLDFSRGGGLYLVTRNDDRSQYLRMFQALSKECRYADALFVGFEPADEEWPKIESAIDIYGDAYLRIAAARIFLGCTAPHFANILVTRGGSLVSIDHDSARFEDGTDFHMLFRFTRRSSHVFDLLADVAALTEDDIRAAVAEIPNHPACGPTSGLAEYFVERLALWKALYTGEPVPERAVAQAAV